MAVHRDRQDLFSSLAGGPISGKVSELCHLLALYGEHKMPGNAQAVGKGDSKAGKTGMLKLHVLF